MPLESRVLAFARYSSVCAQLYVPNLPGTFSIDARAQHYFVFALLFILCMQREAHSADL
jgi:hypothetical protein